MSLNTQMVRQRDFSAGEVDPDALRRDDLEVLGKAVRYARNLVSTHTGGLMRRPGRSYMFRGSGVITDFKPFDGAAYKVCFYDGGIRVRTADGTQVAVLFAPWTDTDLDSLVFEPVENEMFIAWGGQTQVLKVSRSNSWTLTAYSFAVGLNGTYRAPFYRFQDTQNVTMRPSALEGTIDVTFSANVLDPSHKGALFRYSKRQIECLRVVDSRNMRARVIEPLPPTYRLNVESSKGFSVGQIVETDTTNVKAEVVSINATAANQVTIVPIGMLTVPVEDEKLVGPSAVSKVTGVAVSTTNGATLQWDEQFVSDYRGWPGSVSKDRQRLIMTNFRQKKNAILWSAAGNPRDALIGAEADNAMLEYISAECQVFHVVGGYDEFAVTDRGVFYIPVSVGTPLKPGSVEFRPIFNSELSSIRPIEVTEGLIFIDKSRTGVYAISATGQTARPYLANEVNRYHRQLFTGIRSLAVTSGTERFPSRQIFAVNDDGTVVVGQFNPDSSYVGWLKWDGPGQVKSVAGAYDAVVFMSVYTLSDGFLFEVAERLDYDMLCDCARSIVAGSAADFLQMADGSAVQMASGANITLGGVFADIYRGRQVSLFGDGIYLGEIVVPSTGLITGYGDYSTLTIGLSWSWQMQPIIPHFEGGQVAGQAEKRRKVERLLATVRDTQEFSVGSRIFGSYRGGEDTGAAVPARDETYTYREIGRSFDPVIDIRSTFPCAFKLIELGIKVTL